MSGGPRCQRAARGVLRLSIKTRCRMPGNGVDVCSARRCFSCFYKQFKTEHRFVQRSQKAEDLFFSLLSLALLLRLYLRWARAGTGVHTDVESLNIGPHPAGHSAAK